MGNAVWNSIYKENCMLDKMTSQNINPSLQCSEETLLFQLISGVHASVNMHIASHWTEESNETFRNYTAYYEGLGKYPDRIKNMHFVYALTVRALNLVANELVDHDYTTGLCEKNDSMTGIYMMDLLANTIIHCQESFNESALFTQNKPDLLNEIQDKFFNISRIFDCISCDKCRLNGKVQITGLGTALKILFTNQRDLKKLQKTELISLIHLTNKLSESV
jgi:ERO1-like protein alpha